MEEMQAPVPETPVEKSAARREELKAKTSESNESFLGSLLVILLVLVLAGIVAFFSFFGYRLWRDNQALKNSPSIERMTVERAPAAADAGAAPTTEEKKEESKPAATVDKATLDVKVMNGGAARGSAGTFAETLKKAGYAKTTFGNTVGDYTGATIYFAEGKEAEAEALKADVVKTYPNATTTKAVATNKDTTAAILVVILGK